MKKMIVLLLLTLALFACDAPVEIEETTLTLSTHVVEDGEIVYRQLEPGIVYHAASVRAANGSGVHYRSLTADSNGSIQILADDTLCFVTGDVEDNFLVTWNGYLDMRIKELTAYRSLTFTYAFVAHKGDGVDDAYLTSNAYEPVATSTPRVFTISAWEGSDPDFAGAPRVVMTVELIYQPPENDLEAGYTLEILSIERTTPVYW